MLLTPADLGTLAAGGLVGGVLGLIGGGGSVLAVPLLVYGVGVASPHVAIGTSAIAVSVSALSNLVAHARAGNVKWPCAGVFSVAGVVGALLGSSLAKLVDGRPLLALFGVMMIVVGAAMLRPTRRAERADVRLSRDSARELLPRLVGTGLGVGTLSGFFGIGGGFLIVPGIMLGSGMPMLNAIGSSLLSVGAFGLTTAINYAISGLVDWIIAAFFIAGGLVGGMVGMRAAIRLAAERRMLTYVFAGVVFAVAIYMLARTGLPPWLIASKGRP